MESITVINKSGKVISTGKHLVNIFKDARDAYNEKKNELKAETLKRIEYKNTQKLLAAREETRSVASSHRSHRSHRTHRSKREGEDRSRPPLTNRNLAHISETGSDAGRSRHGSRHGSSHRGGPRSSSHYGERIQSPDDPLHPHEYRHPYAETALESRPDLVRRQTDFVNDRHTVARRQVPRHSASNPSLRGERDHIDMNLAYGDLPHPSSLDLALPPQPAANEVELKATVSKLDNLLMEAHCLQHSATTIIAKLQANPEAMAAVALTLAELSNLVTKMSPSILSALRSSSPAVFALLASPQFLIASGVAIGVTVVMFGGFKIIKRIQEQNTAKQEANRMEEAMVFEAADYDHGSELSSIETWRRGIADAEAQSVATSVDGEFITPEADRQRRERIRERAREERRTEVGSVRSESVRSESTIRRKEVPPRSSSHRAKSVVTTTTEKTSSGKEKKKKSNALTLIFKKNKEGKEKESKKEKKSSHHHPRLIEV